MTPFKLLINEFNSTSLLLQYLLIFGLILLFTFNVLMPSGEQQFVYLAQSFLQGKLYFTQIPGTWADGSFYQNHVYWPTGPFPALVLIPFVALFGMLFPQGIIQFILNILNFILLFSIAKKITNNTNTSLWFSFAYIFSSSYLLVGLIPWSWWFAQILTTTLLLLAINEFLSKRRWFLIGLLIGLALSTRISLLFSSIFFLLNIIFTRDNSKTKIYNLCYFCSPIFAISLLLIVYNLARFNNPFEFGYSYHLPAAAILVENLKHGVWNVKYYPTNLYYLFLKSPEAVFIPGTKILTFPFIKPDIWGMSIFFTSPWLVWVLGAPWKEKNVKFATITALSILLFLLGYFSTGVRQLGYRYALDFSPFLFIILAHVVKHKMSTLLKIIIISSFIFNLYMFPLTFSVPLEHN